MIRAIIAMEAIHCTVCAAMVFVVAGCSSISPSLAERRYECGIRSYAAKNVSDCKLVSVDYIPPQHGLVTIAVSPSRMIVTNSLVATVTARDAFGTTEVLGWFDAGKIVEREFNKVVKWNFALPPAVVPSTAEFSFSIDQVSLRKEADDVISTLEMSVKISRVGHRDEVAYKKSFAASRRGQWKDGSVVPESFYAALNEIIRGFLEDFGEGRSILALKEWEKTPVLLPPGPRLKQPTIESCLFTNTNENRVCCGTCEVACNDYGVPAADAYALSYIAQQCAQQCRHQFGIGPERVRIVYDVKKFENGHGRYVFHAFARSKEPVLAYDPKGKRGSMTGDLSLMGMTYQQAKEEMEKRIQEAMDRVVSAGPGVRGAAIVHFEPPAVMDDVYGLLTIPFWLGGL